MRTVGFCRQVFVYFHGGRIVCQQSRGSDVREPENESEGQRSAQLQSLRGGNKQMMHLCLNGWPDGMRTGLKNEAWFVGRSFQGTGKNVWISFDDYGCREA